MPRRGTDEKYRTARIELGRVLKNRRENLPGNVSQRIVAERIGMVTQSYHLIENGTNSTGLPVHWVGVADVLQLDAADLLVQVWATRDGMTFKLPPKGDPRRQILLDLAIEQGQLEPSASTPERQTTPRR